MPTARRPFDFYIAVHQASFWQDNRFSEDTKTSQLCFSKCKLQQHNDNSKIYRDLFVRHLEHTKDNTGIPLLLKASANVVQINRHLLQSDPIPYGLLLNESQCAKATAHVIRIIGSIEAKNKQASESNVHALQRSDSASSTGCDIAFCSTPYRTTVTMQLARLMRKYSSLDPWAKMCIALAKHAAQRPAYAVSPASTEHEDWRHLHAQLKQSLRAAKQDLAAFENVCIRTAPSMVAFGSAHQNTASRSDLLPMTLPDVLSGGTILVADVAGLKLLQDLFVKILADIDEIRLHHLNPRIAEFNEAQTALAHALRKCGPTVPYASRQPGAHARQTAQTQRGHII